MVHSLVRRGDIVVDIGVNWGLYSYCLRRLVGPHGWVYGFEPNPAMAPALRRLRRLSRVTIESVGLSDREGEAELRIPVVDGRQSDYLASLVTRPDVSASEVIFTVPVRRLDEMLPATGSTVGFIKCDVEGHELAVLSGACETLNRSRPRILVEIEQRHTEIDIGETFALMYGHGYRGYALAGHRLRPIEEFDVQRDQLDLLDGFPGLLQGYINQFLFVPDELPSAELDALL